MADSTKKRAGGRQHRLSRAGDRGRELVDLDVAARVGNGDPVLEGEGIAVGTISGLDGVMLPERVRRTATPEQKRRLAATVQLVRTHMAVLDELAMSVRELRRAGLSWETIGWVTGLTAAGARKRWGGPS